VDSLRRFSGEEQVDVYLWAMRCRRPTNDALSSVLVENRNAVIPLLERRLVNARDEEELNEIANALRGLRRRRE
jgi:hypothetical protein